jgi:N,N'-diacetyllegionaminate synthase
MAEPHRCLIVGEVAQAHDGSLGQAHAYIDAIAKAGADAVKFQTHIATAESTPGEQWRVPFSRQDASRYDYWRRMEFTEPQWAELKKHADERKLLFLSSPFSLEAIALLSRVGVWAWKIASGELTNPLGLEMMAKTRRPFILSTGMSTFAEIDEAVARIRRTGQPFTLLQCTSKYPCPPEEVGLNLLEEFRQRYECKVGLSDHTGSIFAGLAATALGADMIEVHVTFSREMFGPDVPASLTVPELTTLVDGARAISSMLDHPVNKNDVARELEPMRHLFQKSVALRRPLSRGTVLTADHLTGKKPGTGIPVSRMQELVGRTLVRDVGEDELLSWDDAEQQRFPHS